jgi:hypothetical protein
MVENENRVSGQPSKAFFVEMITRDLGITDCILDLIDNSIDHAVTTSQVDVMASLTNGHRPRLRRFYVALKLTTAGFAIEDNCGGISIDDARTRVFRFGDPHGRTSDAGLSVYGIGMKRAFFKLGEIIRVRSATSTERFIVDINVKRWLARGDGDWDFEFKEHGPLRDSKESYPKRSTRITIGHLHKQVAERFADPAFLRSLRDKIAATYGLFLESGLDITVNGLGIRPDLPSIGGYGERMTPARHQLRTGTVETLIIVGVTPRIDNKPHGWYVFCNGRMVLQADRSRTTGWGDNLPQWHSKYQHFAGYVYFHTGDVRNLPWTTTKQSVVTESPVYQAALAEMQVQARPVLNFLNNLYPDPLTEAEVPEREVLTKARSIPLTSLARSDTSFSVYIKDRSKREIESVSIQFAKPRRLVDRIRRRIGRTRMSASSVGSFTFDYYVKQELD